MSLLSRIQERRKAKRELKEKIRESSRRFGQEKIELEKGDLFAILFSGFFTFILPIMLVLTGMCLFAYFFFTNAAGQEAPTSISWGLARFSGVL